MRMNKAGALPILAILLFATIGFIISTGYVNLGEITGSGGYIERPVFKWVKCEPTGGTKYAGEFALQSGGEWLYKPTGAVSDYDVIVSWPDSQYRIEWWVCNSKLLNNENCRIDDKNRDISMVQGKTLTIQKVKPEEFVWVKYQKYTLLGGNKDSSNAKYKIAFQPYGLRVYDVLGGGGTFLNPNDCTVPLNDPSWKDRLISTDLSKASKSINPQGELERTLTANEVRNFVSGYVTSPASDKAFFKYKNQDAWCLRSGTSATIFKVNKIVAGSGTYKVASVEWSDQLDTATCCPGDKKPGYACNDDFKWISTQPVKEDGTTAVQCSAFNPCQGGALTPYDKQTIAKYSCVSGKCVLETKKVECAGNVDCNDANDICDTNTWKCVNANVALDGEIIKTQADNDADCKKQGGVWVSEKTEDKTLLNYIGIGEPKVITTSYCKFSKFNWSAVSWILFGVAVITLFIYFRQPIFAILGSMRRTLRI